MACKPRCDPANESVVSELKNFELAFFGAIQKTCVNGQVVWTLPCNLAQGMACYPREANEGVACYILRLFELFGLVASGAWDVNVQYCERAFVTYGGQGYVALVINQAQQPDLFPAVWQLYIERGATGPAGPPGASSPLTTKGDIWGYDTADNRIPVGTDGDVLTADSSQALGVIWAPAPPSADTASNLGTGEGVFASKVANDFQFKSLVAGTNVSLSSTGTEITIDASLPPGALSEYYESPGQTITTGGGLTLAHGLTGRPVLIFAELECTTAEFGYSIGDRLAIISFDDSGDRGVAIVPDATNIVLRYAAVATVFEHINKGTGAGELLTNANWDLVVRAWL